MTPSDGEGISRLAAACPDAGLIPFHLEFVADPYRVFHSQSPELEGVVAVEEGSGQVIGCGLVYYSRRIVGGEPRRCALLNTLMVHPAWRRLGVASALARWRRERALERNGQEGLFIGVSQHGNLGSMATLTKVGLVKGGMLQAGLVRMRTAPPEQPRGLEVRLATASDLEQIAAGLNEFYAGHDYYTPQTGASLAAWLAATATEEPIHHLWVAVGRGGEIKAGMGLFSRGRLVRLCFGPLPPTLRLLNRLVSIIPANGIVREVVADKLWFRPGEEASARYLWESIRWQRRNEADVLRMYFDPRGPIARVPRFPFWLPRATLHIYSNRPAEGQVPRPIFPF
jgi:GNAT superfamily N-acetyltransferase